MTSYFQSQEYLDEIKQYPVLLFTVSKGDQVIGLYCKFYAPHCIGELFEALSDNIDDPYDLLGNTSYEDIIRDKVHDFDGADYSVGWYYRLVELVQQAIQKEHPELTLGKIEVTWNWEPVKLLRDYSTVDYRV